MKTKWKKALASGLLALVFAAGGTLPVLAQAGAAVAGKDEVVYASLSANGAVEGVYVVNSFEVEGAGTLRDYGDYTEVLNLTTTQAMQQTGSEVAVAVEPGGFYYQGNLGAVPLPWAIAIGYTLDGAPVSPEELGGRAGRLEIAIATRQNPAVDSVFYDNYMLQISLTLDADKCANIRAEGATLANAGKNKVVAFTVMPGKDGEYTLTADVVDFSMAGFEISGVPFSMDIGIPDTDEMVEGMEELADGVGELNDGVGELYEGVAELDDGVEDLYDGVADLHSGVKELADGVAGLDDGTQKLADGSGEFKNGLVQIGEGGSGLEQGSAEINGALQAIAGALAGVDLGALETMDISALAQLPAALRMAASGLDQLGGGLAALQQGYSAAFAALDAAIAALPDGAVSEEELAVLYMLAAADPAAGATLNKLVEYYAYALTVHGTYAMVQPAFAAVEAETPALAAGIAEISTGLNQMAAGIEQSLALLDGLEDLAGLAELATGLAQLAASYGAFHQGLAAYLAGVGEIAQSYPELHAGLKALAEGTGGLRSGTADMKNGTAELVDGVGELADGAGELASGVKELHDGTGEMYDGVADLPEEMQAEIDKLLADYDTADFTPVSFVSPQNTSVEYVQFVFMAAGIEAPEHPADTPQAEAEETVWDRFLNLFR